MKVWVDADACPREAKDLVFRTAQRLQVETVLVACQPMRVPSSPYIHLVTVAAGLDAADDYITQNVAAGDVVVVEDIPLAARIVDAGAMGIDPRGAIHDPDNIKNKLATRNLLAELRDAGMVGGGPAPYKAKDRARFASALDRVVQQRLHDS